jgi:hypothetical protein
MTKGTQPKNNPANSLRLQCKGRTEKVWGFGASDFRFSPATFLTGWTVSGPGRDPADFSRR